MSQITVNRIKGLTSGGNANTLVLNTSSTDVLWISSSAKVGIGTGSPTTALTLGTSHTATVQNGGSTSAPSYAITTGAIGVNGTYVPAANTLGFVVGGAERGRFTANGLTFNGDTAAANALDDYEEGTWTGSVGAAYGFTPGGSATFNGNYVKIGDQVTANCSINFDTSATLALGDRFIIQGLPFIMTGSVNGVGGGSFIQPGSFASGTHVVGTCAANSQSQDEIMCVVTRVNGTPPALNATNVNIGITYKLTNTF